jgi:hypothetical protein
MIVNKIFKTRVCTRVLEEVTGIVERYTWTDVLIRLFRKILKDKAVPLHAMKALGIRGVIAPTHLRPRQ